MVSIPMYDATEFLTNRDESGIIGFGSFGRVRDCFHQKLGRVAVKCFGIEGNAAESEELRQKLVFMFSVLMVASSQLLKSNI